jgi:dipeptidyl aminopeptidase/acylaminoacyl peptidase
MALVSGTRLGPFEIVAALGAGGMGEVYRARDPRLRRDVAIKVLPSSDPDRAQRFELEARAVAALSHPNILSLFDIGTADGVSYLVTELLDGETLRQRLARGALPPRKAIELASQVAEGLAAAHERGIAHRDLKPENLLVTKDGRMKILDFGLARITAPADTAETLADHTAPGAVLGTVGYMAPEQVRGEKADGRADIFALGAILHEMLSGERAFRRETPIETAHAIAKDDPPPLPQVDAGLASVVHRCLEKRPEERFQSARDIAFALEALSGGSASAHAPVPPAPARRWRPLAAVIGAALLCAGAAAALVVTRRPAAEPAIWRRLTFQRGAIHAARFTPDGQSVVYGAAWGGRPFEVFTARVGTPESRPLGLADAIPLAMSSGGELAILTRVRKSRRYEGPIIGTLARVPVGGGAPRELLDGVTDADWSPDGSELAAVHMRVEGIDRLEYELDLPIGHTIYRGRARFLRFSPDGARVAFARTDVVTAHNGQIIVVDRQGTATPVGGRWAISGLTWSPSGREILFAGGRPGDPLALRAVTLGGRERVLARIAGDLTVHDVSAAGRVLVTRDSATEEIKLVDTREHDLSWLDRSRLSELSLDGSQVLFGECGAGPPCTAYLRRTDGSPAVKLAEGWPVFWSPDGRWVEIQRTDGMFIVPTGAGNPEPVSALSPLAAVGAIKWSPDGKRILVEGNEAGRPERLWVQDLPRGTPRPVTDEGVLGDALFSADGARLALQLASGVRVLVVDSGAATEVTTVGPDERMVSSAFDGASLFVAGPQANQPIPPRVEVTRVEIASGRRQKLRELAAEDPTGVIYLVVVGATADGGSVAYGVQRRLGELYVADGLPLD